MSVKLKTLIISWIILIIVGGSFAYYTYDKFKSGDFVEAIKKNVEENYPGSSLKIQKVDYHFGLDMGLELKEAQLERAKVTIWEVDKVAIKIPWWLVLTGQGQVQINLENVNLAIDRTNHQSGEISAHKMKLRLPRYIAESSYNIRVKNVSLVDSQKNYQVVSLKKLIIKNFSSTNKAIFEFESPLVFGEGETKTVVGIRFIGEITPYPKSWRMTFRGDSKHLEGVEKLPIDGLIFEGKADLNLKDFDLYADFNVLLDKLRMGDGNIGINGERFKMKLHLSQVPMNLFEDFFKKLTIDYVGSNLSDGQVSVRVENKFSSKELVTSAKLTFQAPFEIDENYKIEGKWLFQINGDRIDSSFITPRGELSYFRRASFSPKDLVLNQFSEEIGFTGLDVGLIFPLLKPFTYFSVNPEGQFFTSLVTFKNCPLKDGRLNGILRMGETPIEEFYTVDLNLDASLLKLNYQHQDSKKSFQLTAQDFPLIPQFKLFDEFFSATTGQITGQIDGQWEDDWRLGTWGVKLKTKDTIETRGLVPELLTKLISEVQLSGNPSVDFSLNGKLALKKFSLIELSTSAQKDIKLSGELTPKSQLLFIVRQKKKNKVLNPNLNLVSILGEFSP